MDLPGPRKSDPPVHLRRILVYSPANADGQAKARARKLATAAEELDRLMRTAGTRFHPTADAVAARATAIATKRRVMAYLRTAITHGATGKPVLSWHFDQAAIDAEAAADGWYALLTNLDPGQADAAEVFRRYKGQHVVERRYGEFKGPLAVTPLFLKTNRRIAALITVICLALLIFCLAGRQVRQALGPPLHPIDAEQVIQESAGDGRQPGQPDPADRTAHIALGQQNMGRDNGCDDEAKRGDRLHPNPAHPP